MPEKYIPNIAVAAVDILGVKEALRKDSDAKVAFSAIQNLKKSTQMFGVSRVATFDPGAQKSTEGGDLFPKDFRFYFSDAAYLFSSPTTDISKQIEVLSTLAIDWMRQGFLHTTPYFLRIGIATGNLRYEENNGLISCAIGTAMVKAYELESNQDWIGVSAFRSDLKEKNNRYGLYSDFEVPLKSQCISNSGKPKAINWVEPNTPLTDLPKERILNTLSNELEMNTPNKSVSKKIQNTINFVRSYDNEGSTNIP